MVATKRSGTHFLSLVFVAALLVGCGKRKQEVALQVSLPERPRAAEVPQARPATHEPVMRSTRGAFGLAHAPYFPNGAMPVYALMHGLGDTPEGECPWFETATRARGYLLCPKGNVAYSGGFAWNHNKEQVRERFDGAWLATGNLLDHQVSTPRRTQNTLIGFSNGASAAAEAAIAQPGEWQHLILLAMKVSLDVNKLKKAGVERIVFAAGEHDMSAHSMQLEAKRLNTAGLPTLYLSLGKVGHTFPRDLPTRLETALGWLESP